MEAGRLLALPPVRVSYAANSAIFTDRLLKNVLIEITPMKKNYFIALEGIDGSGKSTQIKLLSGRLQQEGHKVYTTSEPTDSAIGSLIRSIFRGKLDADHKTIAALYLADRLDHLLNKTNGILKKME